MKTATMKNFKNILYVNESSVDQEPAIARAVSLAENNQADLTVVDVIPTQVITAGVGLPPGGPISIGLQEAIVANHRSDLEYVLQPFADRLSIRMDVFVGKPFLEVIRTVLKNEYDLVIKPAENPIWAKRLFGSDDMHLLRKCPCPLWLMKPNEKSNYTNIVAAIDCDQVYPAPSGRDLNRAILELAASLALSDFASLHIVHAWEALSEVIKLSGKVASLEGADKFIEKMNEYHRNEMTKHAEKLRGWIGNDTYNYLSPSLYLPKGPAEKMIPQMAVELDADLVVMGTVARAGISGVIIGNTAEAILEQFVCSVLALKPPGFKTPVKLEP